MQITMPKVENITAAKMAVFIMDFAEVPCSSVKDGSGHSVEI